MHGDVVVLLDVCYLLYEVFSALLNCYGWLDALRDFNLEAILLHHLDYEQSTQERVDIDLRCL